MVKPSTPDRLDHIIEAIRQIEDNTLGLTLESFRSNRFLQLGVERCLEIISEASRHVPEELKAQHPDIPWRRIGDIGNRIRHAYHAVDTELVWEIVTVELKQLRTVVQAIKTSSSP